MKPKPSPNTLRRNWHLDPDVVFLNHGSFGACPIEVLAYQGELRERIEQQPVQFFVRDLVALVVEARQVVSEFLGAEPKRLAFVDNATTGVNTALRAVDFEPGDELLVTSQEYNASRNAAADRAEKTGARLVEVGLPFPVADPTQIVDAILNAVTDRTRLVLFDHIVSQNGFVFPAAAIVERLNEKGVMSLVDGAHAPGMVPLDLESLGATFYTGNCHKWLCGPKSAAFLYVSKDMHHRTKPLVVSHGRNTPGLTDDERFHWEFDWVGTRDPTAILAVPKALDVMARLGGGWPAIMERNRALALEARRVLVDTLDATKLCPDEMVGSLAAVQLPDGDGRPHATPLYLDPQQEELLKKYEIEVPIIPWPRAESRLLRVSAQLYNHVSEYQYLADCLVHESDSSSTPGKN